MKKMSLQWRLTCIITIYIAVICGCLTMLVYKNGVYYIDSLKETVDARGDDNGSSSDEIYISIPEDKWDEFANDFSPAEQIRQNLKVIDNEGRLKVYKEFENVRSKFIEIVGAFEKENIIKVPCHNDTLAGNFLGDENKLTLIDWEYN